MIVIIKPTYACNLACKYCYLSNDTKVNKSADIEMIKDALIQLRDSILKESTKVTTIIWHGGEPLLWGYENYRQIFNFINSEFKGYPYQQSIQTNLSLINQEFINLFREHNVSISFSLDGMQEIHDAQRVDKKGRPTFHRIMEKVNLCRSNNINLGCIVVATRKHIGKIEELYHFMVQNEISFKLNPMFCAGEAENNADEYTLTVDEYANMSIRLFDLWYNDTESKIQNQKFIDIASSLITRRTSLCVFSKNCQDNVIAISPFGDVFPCGRFCDNEMKEYSYGNLLHEPLNKILERKKKSDIYNRSLTLENSECVKCEFYDICFGGCLHDGYLVNKDFRTKTFLCEAYKKVFSHIQEVISADSQINTYFKNIHP